MTICDDLRQSVLQAAIQGKLTKQLPEDGTAGDLMASIKAEKEQLIKEKKIKKEKPLASISEDEIPFDIPDNWEWVKLGELTSKIGAGNTPPGGPQNWTWFPRGTESPSPPSDNHRGQGCSYCQQFRQSCISWPYR